LGIGDRTELIFLRLAFAQDGTGIDPRQLPPKQAFGEKPKGRDRPFKVYEDTFTAQAKKLADELSMEKDQKARTRNNGFRMRSLVRKIDDATAEVNSLAASGPVPPAKVAQMWMALNLFARTIGNPKTGGGGAIDVNASDFASATSSYDAAVRALNAGFKSLGTDQKTRVETFSLALVREFETIATEVLDREVVRTIEEQIEVLTDEVKARPRPVRAPREERRTGPVVPPPSPLPDEPVPLPETPPPPEEEPPPIPPPPIPQLEPAPAAR